MSHVSRRLGALVAASALTVTGLTTLTTPAANAATDDRPVKIATKWLKNQLTNGLVHNDQYDFDDIGLTLDVGFGFVAVGDTNAANDLADEVSPKIANGYAVSDEFASTEPYGFVQVGRYGAQAAKALVFADVADQDATTWAGTDLVDLVEDLVTPAGKLTSDSSYGDYTNTIGQAYAARGLHSVSSPEAAAATTYLLLQQCAAGNFRLALGDTQCATSEADTDATAITVQQLAAIETPTPQVTAALASAKAWLLSQQKADGSFGGGASTAASNSNSTASAGIALGELGEQAAAIKAAVWVRQLQADETNQCPTPLFGETGAIAYNADATAAARVDGITVNAQDQWRRATAPSIGILLYAPTATPNLAVTGPTGFRKTGTSATYTATGIVPGDKVCFTVNGANRPVAAGADGKASITVTLPAGTASRTVSVKNRPGTAKTVVTKVLGVAKLSVTKSKSKVKSGKSVTVTVGGLAPGEAVTVSVKGDSASGVASSAGKFVAKLTPSKKVGKKTITARGQFGDIRNGSTTVKVIKK